MNFNSARLRDLIEAEVAGWPDGVFADDAEEVASNVFLSVPYSDYDDDDGLVEHIETLARDYISAHEERLRPTSRPQPIGSAEAVWLLHVGDGNTGIYHSNLDCHAIRHLARFRVWEFDRASGTALQWERTRDDLGSYWRRIPTRPAFSSGPRVDNHARVPPSR